MSETNGMVDGVTVTGADMWAGAQEGVLLGFDEGARIRQMESERRWNATPDHVIVDGERVNFVKPNAPAIVIAAEDGAVLPRITRDGGTLDVSGDESRWTEAAARFIAEMRRMLCADG